MNVTLNVLGDIERTRSLLGEDAAAWSTDEVVADLVDIVASVLAGPLSRASCCDRKGRTCGH